MATELPRTKVDAIYDLREAVEAKAQAEQAFERDGSPGARDALLAAQLAVEAKTQDAIDICHECGHAHSSGERAHQRDENVVHVDFRPDTRGSC